MSVENQNRSYSAYCAMLCSKPSAALQESYQQYKIMSGGKLSMEAFARRLWRASAEGRFSKAEWKILLDKYSCCPRCKRQWSDSIKPTVDHIVPLANGGTNYISNIQPLCKSCNVSKGMKSP